MHLYISLIFSLIYSSKSQYYHDKLYEHHHDEAWHIDIETTTLSPHVDETKTSKFPIQNEMETYYDDESNTHIDYEEGEEEEEYVDSHENTVKIFNSTSISISTTTTDESTQSIKDLQNPDDDSTIKFTTMNLEIMIEGQAKLDRDRLKLKIFLFSTIIGLTTLAIVLLAIHFRRKKNRYQGYKPSYHSPNQQNINV